MFKLFTKSSAGRLLSDAVGESTLLTERHDVPHEIDGQRVADFAPDLDDTDPRWWRTRDGHRIAGRLLPNDLAGGGPSPATPLLIGLLPLLAMSTLLLSRLPHIGGLFMGVGVLLMLVVAGTLWAAEGFKTAVSSLLLGAFLPLAAATAALGGPSSGAVAPAGRLLSMVQSPMTLAVPVGALLIIALIFSGSFSKAMLAARAIIGGLVAIVVLAFVSTLLRKLIGPTASVLPWFAVGAGLPWLWAQWNQREWAMRLVAQDVSCPGETSLGAFDAHKAARQQQAEAALRDKTPVITLGRASGIFTGKNDGFAPDAGKPLRMSLDDLTTHLSITGSTGTGKTSAYLRPLIKEWIRVNGGGLFVLDEKDLPGELRGLAGYKLIEPGVRLGLLEGLSPTEATIAIFSVGKGDTAKSASGAGAFYDSASRTMFLHGAMLTRAMVDVERQQLIARGFEGDALEAERRVHWTVASIREQMAFAFEPKTMEVIAQHLEGYVPEHEGDRYMLAGAIEYWSITIPTMSDETRSNTRETMNQKLDPLTSHPDLVAFAHCEKTVGFNLDEIKFGGRFGVNLPEVRYGTGGLLISSLVKARIFSILRKRATYDWKAAGEQRVLGVVDEAAGIVGPEDAAFLKVARGLGFCAVYAVQNFDAYAAKLGSEALTQSFIDNFRSKISLTSTDYTFQVMSKHAGSTRQLKWASNISSVNFARSLDLLAHSALVDQTHPAHKHLRSMLRTGAGLFKEVGDKMGKGGSDDLLKLDPVGQASVEVMPILGPADWDGLAKQFRAVALVQRGGVRRRDIIDPIPLFSFPPEMMQPAPQPEPVAKPDGAGEVPLPSTGSKNFTKADKIAPSTPSPMASDMDAQTPTPKVASPLPSSSPKV